MECIFPVESNFHMNTLKVYWYHILDNGTSQLVYKLLNGKAALQDQSFEYRERVFLAMDKLFGGRAVVEITQVRVSDAGTYRCIIALNGVDYKETALKVTGKQVVPLLCSSS